MNNLTDTNSKDKTWQKVLPGSDEVFEDEITDKLLYNVLSSIAHDMSRDIVTSSLSSFSPVKETRQKLTSGRVDISCDVEDNDEDNDEDSHDGKHDGILEDWEPETSESGSYVIGSSENIGQAQLTTIISSDDHLTINEWVAEEERLAELSSRHRQGSHDNLERIDDVNKSKMAAERLMDLIFNENPFSDSLATKARKTNENHLKAEMERKKEPKVKVKQWNFRLDRLLRKLRATSRKFIQQFCEHRAQWLSLLHAAVRATATTCPNASVHRQGASSESATFDGLSFSEDLDEDGADEDDDEDGADKDAYDEKVVEFSPGLQCTDVDQARDILTTRYKLSDVNKKRSLISWSKWDVAHIVRGPHAQSPIWKSGFKEEMEKSKNLMEELNRSIEAREANLQKLADNQTLDYYKGMALRCFERQQSNPDLQKKVDVENLELKKKSKQNIASKYMPNHIYDNIKRTGQQSEIRSNSLSNLPSCPPHQPQQSDHIKCFILKDLKNPQTTPSSSKPSIMDFFKQTPNNLKSYSVNSKISDEGYDDDVFYREDEPQRSGKTNYQSKSHPFLNTTQSLQAVSQQHRSKMQRRSQQRRRQIKKKLDISFLPRQDKKAASQQNTPTQQTKFFKQNFNCMSRPGESKFNSLRIVRKSPNLQADRPATPPVHAVSSKMEGVNVFSRLYHWFHGKVSGKEF